jgi:hypothetical protein
MIKKIIIFFLLFLCVWNLTKLPYYLVFDISDTADSYARHGLEGSINLGHWIDGYHGTKLKSPAINFLAVHAVIGITVLTMMAMALFKPVLRRRYGLVFFIFAILLGAHTLPAALLMDSTFKRYLFSGTCITVIGAAIWGLIVLKKYEYYQPSSEKYLLYAYSLITLGAYGAGFAEFLQIGKNVVSYVKTNIWPQFGEFPDPLYGHTWFDTIPEVIGLAIFFLWILIVWIIIPVKIYLSVKAKNSPN